MVRTWSWSMSRRSYGFFAVPDDAGVCDMYLQVSLGLHVHLHSAILGRGGERHDLCVVLHRPGLDEGEVNLALSEPTQVSCSLTAATVVTRRRCLSRFESLLRTASGSFAGIFSAL